MALPPQFDDDNGGSDHYEEYDPEIWADQAEADQAYHIMQEYMTGADGFTALQFMDMIVDVKNVEYNDKGEVIGFEFEWEDPSGEYGGYGHAS